MSNKSNLLKLQGILTCIGGILIFLSLGSIYTFGNMLPYFASYLASVDSDDASASYSQYISKCNYIFACTIFGQSVFFPIGGKLGQKFGAKLTIIAGAIIQSLVGVFCTYFACNNYWFVYLTYGMAFGAGIGITYPNILVLVMEWYPNHKGLVNGIVLCGFGLSALIFDRVQTLLINPDNVQQDIITGFSDNAQIVANFPYVFLYLGAIFFVMQVAGVLMMRIPPTSTWPMTAQSQRDQYDEELPLIAIPSSEHELWNLHDQNLQQDNEDEDEQPETSGYDVMEVLKDTRFWQLYVNFFVDGMIIVFVATQWKMYSNKLGITDDAYLSLIGSVSAIFNGLGRVVFGWVLDQTQSFRFTLGSINILLAALLFSWPYCVGTVTPFIWVCLLFGLFSSNFSVFPTIVSFVFGAKNAGINVGLIFTSQIFSAFVAIYVLDGVDRMLGNWHYMCYMIGAVQFFGSCVSLSFKSGNSSHFNNAFLHQTPYKKY